MASLLLCKLELKNQTFVTVRFYSRCSQDRGNSLFCAAFQAIETPASEDLARSRIHTDLAVQKLFEPIKLQSGISTRHWVGWESVSYAFAEIIED